ncbi:hypothetical protein HELRODRAFT_161052 [Helobdella robusta]|uniref:Ig-like domain-containing protein n=1 Tax=Helobdella robusta TaxID=6412 RepID=T1ER25_HELRO|nr:hypothetical protein HELRODRAFT_161052 [Helobdella robusta]ESO01874.1 hypothetical protein HELRODRAFT_161052 [Helobdella robusta]
MKVSDLYLPLAEIPHALNIDGRKNFNVSVMFSHNIRAVTLNINPFNEKFPLTFITVFHYPNTLFQYHLKTEIQKETINKLDILDSIVWKTTPPDTITFDQSGDLHVVCQALIESNPVTLKPSGEIRIYRNSLDRDKPRWLKSKLEHPSMSRMNFDRKENETSSTDKGKYITNGWKSSYVETDYFNSSRIFITLSTSYKISNGTADTCVYTCATDHASETEQTFYSAWVTNIMPKNPVMMVIPCEEHAMDAFDRTRELVSNPNRNKNNYIFHRAGGKEMYFQLVINITRNRPTCVRCRSFDYMNRVLTLFKNDVNITSSTKTTILDRHTNVPDGALHELTLTFLNPSPDDEGFYRCVTPPSRPEQNVAFEIRLR